MGLSHELGLSPYHKFFGSEEEQVVQTAQKEMYLFNYCLCKSDPPLVRMVS